MQSHLKNPCTVLQKRLRSFRWSLLEIYVLKRASVISQRPTIITVKFFAKEQTFYFWLFDEIPCLNISPLSYGTIEFIELNCSCKHIKTKLEIANPAGIYLLKVNNRNTRTRCEICSKLTINTPERRHWRRSGVFIVNFEHISHLVLVFLLLTLNK